MRFDPEIELPAMQAAREAGLEESYSYWRDLYLREIQRSKEREREWDFKQKVLYLIIFGIFVVWFFFYLIGESLLALPNSFHEGTLWQVNWMDRE